MTDRSPRLEWLPPLLVGASAAVVAEVAMAMLLYGGIGLVRSLTTVLAVEGLALAGGLWSAPAHGPDLVDKVRRRWLLCLFAFVAAALFGMAWSVLPQLSEARWGQGAGLAALGALPLYATGSVLGGMSLLAGTDPGRRLRSPGPAAAAGAALGFVLTGLLLPRVPLPASLLIGCLVMLSLGGMVYGGVLAARTEIRVLARRPGLGSEVRVQERHTPVDGPAILELLEGSFLRRRVSLDGKETEPWDVAVVRSMLPAPTAPSPEVGRPPETGSPPQRGEVRLLVVGGGASAVPRSLVRNDPRASVDVIERVPSVVELGREHLETELRIGGHEHVSVFVGNLGDAILGCDGVFDLVLVDTDALAPIGGLAALSAMARRRLPALVRSGGVLAFGPDGSALPPSDVPDGWEVRSYRRPAPHRTDAQVETVRVVRRGGSARWTPVLVGFREVEVT